MIDYALTSRTMYPFEFVPNGLTERWTLSQLFEQNREIYNEVDEFFRRSFNRVGPLVYR